MDLSFSLALLAAICVVLLAQAVRRPLGRAYRYARVRAEGSSPLLGADTQDALYAVVVQVGLLSRGLGLTANAATWLSVACGAFSGVALERGAFGLGAWLLTFAGAADALDGWLARASGDASDAGELLDATADRWVEFAVLAGLALRFRENAALLLLVLVALFGGFMVSYATAKTEALHVLAPRGLMRRTERMVYLVLGLAVTPVVGVLSPAFGLAPLVAALVVIGTVANVSALSRLRNAAQILRDRQRVDTDAAGVST